MADKIDNIIETQVQLESLRKDVEAVNNINTRLDTAIDKLTDVSTSIKSMLAVHEEKIQKQEQVDEIIFNKIRDRGDEIQSIHEELRKEMALTEKRLLCEIKSLKNDISSRVGVLEKYRWIIVGASIVIGFILSGNLSELLEALA